MLVRYDVAQVFDQRFHARLGLGLEVALDVQLAEHLAEVAVQGVDGALPSRLLFADAAQGGRVEVELGVDEGLAQVRRKAVDERRLQVRLPAIDRQLVDRGGQRLQVARLRHHHRGQPLMPSSAVHAAQSKPGNCLARSATRHLVVGLHGVAVLDVGPVRARQPGFEHEDLAGRLVGRLVAGHLQHRLQEADVLLAILLQLRVVFAGSSRDRAGRGRPDRDRECRASGCCASPSTYPTSGLIRFILKNCAKWRARSALVWMASIAASSVLQRRQAQLSTRASFMKLS